MNELKVKDVMTHLVVTVSPADSIQRAASTLVRNRISGAPVVVKGKVVGILSEADVAQALVGPANVDQGLEVIDVLSVMLRAAPSHRHQRTIADVMTDSHIITIGPDENLYRAARLMDRHGIKRLPVVGKDDYLLGIISRGDLVRAMTRDDSDIRSAVADALAILGEECFTDLRVKVDQGVVTLTGVADRLSTRTIAVDIAARVPGVCEVVDRLDFTFNDASLAATWKPHDYAGSDPWAVGPLVKGG